MITTPNAKREELAYELLRWYTLSMADARTLADDVIAALVAATPFDDSWTVANHPLVAWLGDTFMVHWKRASQAFAVAPTLATVTADAASVITSSSATLGGNVSGPMGTSVTAKGIIWSTEPFPPTTYVKALMGSGAGPFSATVGSMPADTLIYFIAFADNPAGTAFSAQDSFTTLA